MMGPRIQTEPGKSLWKVVDEGNLTEVDVMLIDVVAVRCR